MSVKSIYDSRINDTINLRGRSYTVKGFVEYQEGIFRWKDFWVVNLNKEELWLTVEAAVDKQYAFISNKISPFQVGEKLNYKGTDFTVSERGNARVIAVEGVKDVTEGDVITFVDYISSVRSEIILSYEKWEREEDSNLNIEEQYFESKIVLLQDINSYEEPVVDDKPITLAHWQTLKVGSLVVIDNKTYTVDGYACYKANGGEWWLEFLIYADNKDYWLSVENGPDGKLAYSLHQSIKAVGDKMLSAITYNKKKFTLSETVEGIVTGIKGNVDYDNREPFVLKEYISKDNQILSVEDWEGETEWSIGHYLTGSTVTAGFGNSDSPINRIVRRLNVSNGVLSKILIDSLLGIVGILLVFFIINMFKKSVRDSIENDKAVFTYVTTITVEVPSRHKEYVYKSPYGLDATCNHIIRMEVENIKYVTIDTSAVLLRTDSFSTYLVRKDPITNKMVTREEINVSQVVDAKDDNISQRFIRCKGAIVLIYKGDDGITYVQVNENPPKEEESSRRVYYGRHYYRYMYRPNHYYRRDSDFYDNSISRSGNVNTAQYLSTLESARMESARQESVRTRTSWGGGTGFGK